MDAPRFGVALAGPAAFAVASIVGGRMEPGYRARDEPISALAAHGTASAPVMVPGFLALAGGTLALARSLRGMPTAPDPVPTLLGLAGLTVAGAGLARNSDRSCPTRMLGDTDVRLTDDLHAAFSGATFALWIAVPLVAAAKAEDVRFARASRAIGLAATALLLAGGSRARRGEDAWSGAAQRAFLAVALAWYSLAAGGSRSRGR